MCRATFPSRSAGHGDEARLESGSRLHQPKYRAEKSERAVDVRLDASVGHLRSERELRLHILAQCGTALPEVGELRAVRGEVADPDAWLAARLTAQIGDPAAVEEVFSSPDSPFSDPVFDALKK